MATYYTNGERHRKIPSKCNAASITKLAPRYTYGVMSEPNGRRKLAIRDVVCYLKECTSTLDEDVTETTQTVRVYTKRPMATVTYKGDPAKEQGVGSERVEPS